MPRITRMDNQRQSVVILECNQDRVSTEEVGFLNIEEDFYGRDLMTFTCPECGERHQSNIYLH